MKLTPEYIVDDVERRGQDGKLRNHERQAMTPTLKALYAFDASHENDDATLSDGSMD